MSVSTDIRGALQVRAATASGFPASGQRSYEGRTFTPTVGTAWARMTVIPNSERPAVVGAALFLHQGLFQIDLFYPSNASPGTSDIETLGDAVRAVFNPASGGYTQGSETVTTRYVERTKGIEEEADWLKLMITVAWQCYSPNP